MATTNINRNEAPSYFDFFANKSGNSVNTDGLTTGATFNLPKYGSYTDMGLGNSANSITTANKLGNFMNMKNPQAGLDVDTSINALGGYTPDVDVPTETNWMDTFGGMQGLETGMNLFSTGLAGLGYLDDRKTGKLNRKLFQQQIDTNKELLNDRRADRSHVKNVFNSGLGS